MYTIRKRLNLGKIIKKGSNELKSMSKYSLIDNIDRGYKDCISKVRSVDVRSDIDSYLERCHGSSLTLNGSDHNTTNFTLKGRTKISTITKEVNAIVDSKESLKGLSYLLYDIKKNSNKTYSIIFKRKVQ